MDRLDGVGRMGKVAWWWNIVSFWAGCCLVFFLSLYMFTPAIGSYYFSSLVKNTSEVHQLAVENGLVSGNGSKFERVTKFVNKSWNSKLELVDRAKSPSLLARTLTGDCDDKAVLTLSLLKAVGAGDYYFVFARNHACVAKYVNSSYKTYNCLGEPGLIVRKVG